MTAWIPSEWHHVVINYDASGHAAGLKVFFDGRPGTVEVLQDTLAAKATSKAAKKAAPSTATAATAGSAPAVFEIGNKAFGSAFRGGLDDLRIYDRPLTAAEILPLFREEPIRTALVVRPAHREAKAEEAAHGIFSERRSRAGIAGCVSRARKTESGTEGAEQSHSLQRW